MENYELRVLFEKVAQALTGRVVTARLRRPVVSYFDGQAYIRDGKAIIDINPWLDETDQLYVFCHELGHIKSNSATKDVDPSLSPGSLRLSQLGAWSYKNHPKITGIEDAAEGWAQKWLAYAAKYWRRYPAPTELESKLQALADYPMAELLDQAQNTGAAAGKSIAIQHMRSKK
jgi:hypothetical protein